MAFQKPRSLSSLEPPLVDDRQVQFSDQIMIQEYCIVLGDNPGCTSGPPIQLGWEIESSTVRNFQFYEFFRSPDRTHGRQLRISSQERLDMLISAGFTEDECHEATQQVKQDRKLRVESLKHEGWDRISIMSMLNETGRLPLNLLQRRFRDDSDIEQMARPRQPRPLRKSFSLRRDPTTGGSEEFSPKKFGKNLLKTTSESLRQLTVQLSPPFTKNARSA